MKRELFLAIEKAIEKAIEAAAEKPCWDGYIHETLYKEMATAAASVFDASMNGQAFAEKERL